jgi:para-nitrobenzyl esterase
MAAAVMAMAGPLQAAERVVTGGIVHGVELADGGTIFRGIPYAQPPVGELRWKPPAPVIPWQGVRQATISGPPCIQRSYDWNAMDAKNGREDCLYLDVRSPPHAAMARLPVMVWIHGGANRAGSGFGYIDSAIADRGVVLVTLQHRLGIFGFMSLAALTAESGRGASGNYGLMDQIAVLRWVKENIAQFGGDPNNVTLFGHSAGSQDVGLLMLSPLAQGLFQKAIMESGTTGFGLPPRSLAQNEKLGEELQTLMGIPAGPAGLAALRAAPGEALLDATDKLHPPIEDDSFIWLQAVVDGWVIPDAPANLLTSMHSAVPLIIGNSAQELSLHGGLKNARHWVEATYGVHAREALALYGVDGPGMRQDDPVLGDVAKQIATDTTFRCPASWVADRVEAAGAPVWRYQLDVDKPGSKEEVHHGSELSFVFDKQPVGVSPAQWPPLQAYWTNFAKTGDPNGEGLAIWPRYGTAANFLEFTPEGPRAGAKLRGPFCRLLNNP